MYSFSTPVPIVGCGEVEIPEILQLSFYKTPCSKVQQYSIGSSCIEDADCVNIGQCTNAVAASVPVKRRANYGTYCFYCGRQPAFTVDVISTYSPNWDDPPCAKYCDWCHKYLECPESNCSNTICQDSEDVVGQITFYHYFGVYIFATTAGPPYGYFTCFYALTTYDTVSSPSPGSCLIYHSTEEDCPMTQPFANSWGTGSNLAQRVPIQSLQPFIATGNWNACANQPISLTG